MRQMILAVVLVMAALVVWAGAVLSSPQPDYDRMQRSTVVVRVMDAGNELGHGSGVLTEYGVLTVAHVVLKAVKSQQESYRIEVQFFDGEYVEAQVVRQQYEVGERAIERDMALLSIPTTAGYPIAEINCEVQPVGTPLYVVGAPAIMQWSVTEGKVVTNIPRKGFTRDAWVQTDALMWHGNSGGPIFTRDGRVVGLSQSIHKSGMFGSPTGYGFGVSGPRLCEFLSPPEPAACAA